MGFYGNITNTSNTTFSFDRIYPNRLAMEANANNDGIFIGRYVLVEYDQNAAYPNIYIKTVDGETQYFSSPGYEAKTRIQYKEGGRPAADTSKDVFYLGEFGQKQETEKIHFYMCDGYVSVIEDNKTIKYATFKQVTAVNTQDATPYLINHNIDYDEYKNAKGYDSTVWTKVSEESNGNLITRYRNIADLNSVVPTFDLETDAPTMTPIIPHFDADSTNVYYKLHTQPQWGLRVAEKSDETNSDGVTTWLNTTYDPITDTTVTHKNENVIAAINYNGPAFEEQVDKNRKSEAGIKKHDNSNNYITILPTGESGQKYYTHTNKNGEKIYEKAPDIQEMRISLPAIGNMMSDAWDIIHGPLRNDAQTDENSSLQGRLDSFKAMEENAIPVKRNPDGTFVGTRINGNSNKIVQTDKILEENLSTSFDQDDAWIRTEINTTDLDNTNKLSGISIHHTWHKQTDTTSKTNKNIDKVVSNNTSDKIELYTPIVDKAGHIVGKNTETITLPYGYKTFTTEGLAPLDNEGGEIVEDLYTTINNQDNGNNTSSSSASASISVANNTQDTIAIEPYNKWIQTQLTDDKLTIAHEIHAINTEKSSTDLNDLKDNKIQNEINIPDWNYDEAGHIKKKGEHTYTLPYGFKTINVGNNTTESAAPAQTGVEGETADNTQDSLTFTPTNKWIKMVATGNDEIKFGHELSGIEAKEHSSSDTDIANFGDTFNILKFTTDKAGHITAVGEESIKIPSIAFTNETTGNVVTNMAYSYNSNNKTGTFTETRKNIGTLALGSHTGTTITTNGLNILSTDTISGAFNKVQTHINSLNLASTNSDLEWVTDITQANGQIAIARKGTDNLKLNNYSALSSVSSIGLATNDTLNNAFGKLEYRIKEEEKNRAAAIEALDVIDAEDDTKYVSGVSETNGKIAVLRKGTDTLKINNYTIATVSSDVANGDTINSAFGKIQKQIKDIYGNEEIATNFDTIKEIADWLAANDSNADKIIDSIATLNGNDTVSGSVANSIKNAIEGLDSSKSADTNNYISGITITNGKITNIAQTTLPIRTVTSGTANGTILVNGSAINVGGLKSAAYTESAAYATAAQGSTADATAATIATYGDIVVYDAKDFVSKEEYDALLSDYNELKELVEKLNNQINPPQEPDEGGETV